MTFRNLFFLFVALASLVFFFSSSVSQVQAVDISDPASVDPFETSSVDAWQLEAEGSGILTSPQMRGKTFQAIPEPATIVLGGMAWVLASFMRANRSRRSV
ncbi:MAG: hypothetical protein GXP28_10445 [Planctomycetes bacterium]|nr:hypothetical protein [Planctomycetota bacterium]